MTLLLLLSFFSFSQERVANGNVVAPSSSSNLAIAMMESNVGLCSASFIHPRYLITAAHCTSNADPNQTEVRIRDSGNQFHYASVRRLVTHPLYQLQSTSDSTKIKYDIGIIELENPFSIPVVVNKIANINEFIGQEKDVLIYGFGRNTSGGGSGTLRWGHMTATVQALAQFFGRKGIDMIPATNQALCSGDSGGPVFKVVNSQKFLIGVNSLSNGCRTTTGVNSKAEIVFSHLAWIRQYVPNI